MITQHTKNITIIATLFCVGTVSGLVFFLIHIHQAGAKLNELSAVIANSDAQRQQNIELQRLLKETSDERMQLESLLLTENETIVFLTEIENIARNYNVAVTTKSLQVVAEEKGGRDNLVIQFEIEGTDSSAKKFIRLLEELPYASQLTQLKITKTKDGENTFSGTIELSLSLLPYDQ